VTRNVLVVTTVVPDEAKLARTLRDLLGGNETIVRVVAPAAKLSWLEWLTNDEDRARSEAREAAERTAEAIDEEAQVRIDRASQDTDAAQAVEDAVRDFPADEIVVLTRPDEDASWLEQDALREAFDRFGVPVRHVELPDRHD
jgi:hypothetical protein